MINNATFAADLDQSDIAATENTIQQQAAYEKLRHRDVGTQLSYDAIRQGQYYSAYIMQVAARKIQAVMSFRDISPEEAQVQAQNIMDQAKALCIAVHQESLYKAQQLQSTAQDQENSLDTIASNLNHLLEQPADISGVHLQPVGTDLYVRYYGDSPAHLPVQTSPVSTIGLRSNERLMSSAHNALYQVNRQVYGKLLGH